MPRRQVSTQDFNVSIHDFISACAANSPAPTSHLRAGNLTCYDLEIQSNTLGNRPDHFG